MKIFQVGGSIRDEILGVEANDKDWVVVGSSPEKMIAKGFKPIGKDFPVFLHPESNEEYALARTEKKFADLGEDNAVLSSIQILSADK